MNLNPYKAVNKLQAKQDAKLRATAQAVDKRRAELGLPPIDYVALAAAKRAEDLQCRQVVMDKHLTATRVVGMGVFALAAKKRRYTTIDTRTGKKI
jgi:hypothetical protein